MKGADGTKGTGLAGPSTLYGDTVDGTGAGVRWGAHDDTSAARHMGMSFAARITGTPA